VEGKKKKEKEQRASILTQGGSGRGVKESKKLLRQQVMEVLQKEPGLILLSLLRTE